MSISADQLPPASIKPGDSIEYYSPVSVWGEKHAHRTAVVTRVDSTQRSYPLRLNTRELLDRFAMIRHVPKADAADNERYYRKMYLFELVDGTFEAPEPAHFLNAGMRDVEKSVMQATQRCLRRKTRESSRLATVSPVPAVTSTESAPVVIDASSDDDVEVKAGGKQRLPVVHEASAIADDGGEVGVNGSNAGAVDNSTAEKASKVVPAEQLKTFHGIPKSGDRWKLQHRANPKNTGGWIRRSKKRRHQKQCALSRDTKHVRHARTSKSQFLQKLIELPHVQEALTALRMKRASSLAMGGVVEASPPSDVAHLSNKTNEPEGAEVVDLTEDSPVVWPPGVTPIKECVNPHGVLFKPVDNLGRCQCVGQCYIDECANSYTDIFCCEANCALQGDCNNALSQNENLELFVTELNGYGVRANSSIDVGVVIAEYAGELQPFEGVDPRDPDSAILKENSGYTLLLSKTSLDRKFVFIEAVEKGSIGRFMNHSCDANCRFREVNYLGTVCVAIVTVRKISRFDELTVDYGEPWFAFAGGS